MRSTKNENEQRLVQSFLNQFLRANECEIHLKVHECTKLDACTASNLTYSGRNIGIINLYAKPRTEIRHFLA